MALGKYETIKARYEKRWVRDDQLRRYWELGCLTDSQYIEIYQTKYPDGYPEGLEPKEPENEEEETVTESNETEMESTVTEEDAECTQE